jgi:predicted RNA-binding Zn ribbon-like protein
MANTPSHPKYSKFRFDAGSLALNLVTTVRHRGSQPRDLLPTAAALADWFSMAGLQSHDDMPSDQDYREALLLREAIYRALGSLIQNEIPDAADMQRINANAAYALAVPQIEISSCSIHWESVHPARSCLAEIARDAVMVIGNAERHRLKMCNNQGCRMLFVDNSPANRRRWCAMSICGNREKIRTHRQKKRSAGIA